MNLMQRKILQRARMSKLDDLKDSDHIAPIGCAAMFFLVGLALLLVLWVW